MFFPTSMISLMVTFQTFSFLDFRADLDYEMNGVKQASPSAGRWPDKDVDRTFRSMSLQ
jgi:hypothetical protein